MEKNPTYLFVVAAALIDERRRILVQKRPEGKSMAGLWEFPGGKVESGEIPEMALARELEEELDIVVQPADLMPAAFASEPLGQKHLILLLYCCRDWRGTPESQENTQLRWVDVEDLHELDMPPADRPLIDGLIREIGVSKPAAQDSDR